MPNAKIALDLFTPVVAEARQHPIFKRVIRRGLQGDLDVISSWSRGFLDRDGKFIQEFQSTFTSCFWELYLFASFRALDFEVDFSKTSPDFDLDHGSSMIRPIAEAVVANQAQGLTPEWQTGELTPEVLENLDLDELTRHSCVRLANAIESKSRRYLDYYSTLAHCADRPFIVCVAPFEQPFFYLQNVHAIRQVLYGYDQPIAAQIGGVQQVVGHALTESVEKPSGAEIALGLFTRPDFAHISAVIFSCTATIGKVRALSPQVDPHCIFSAERFAPDSTVSRKIVAARPEYSETLLDGLHVMLNPYATVPLNCAFARGRPVAIHTYDPTSREYLVRMPPDFLLIRQINSFVAPETIATIDPTLLDTKPYAQPTRAARPDGILRRIGGTLGSFRDLHLGNHKHWTVLVGCHINDGDWMAQARPGTFESMARYVQANQKDDSKAFIIFDSFETKEEALAAAAARIDSLDATG